MDVGDLRDVGASGWSSTPRRSDDGWCAEWPPNGQGIAPLEMLKITGTFARDASGHNSLRSSHLMIEAKTLAYGNMQHSDVDPRSALPFRAALKGTRARAGEAHR